MQQKIIPVILSGGAGTRLWPLSRPNRPKQFLPLLNGRSTFELTLERVSDRNIFAPPMVVTNADFKFLVADELQRAGTAGRIVLEPARRDSAAAIAVAAALAHSANPQALLLVLAADHLVEDREAFVETALNGVAASREGHLITFGIKPDRPADTYGYIKPAHAIDAHVRQVERFVEKPSSDKARLLIEEGCLWNSGNFLFRADALLAELQRFEPEIHAAALAAAREPEVTQLGPLAFELLPAHEFEKSPAKSIDFAVMERTSRSAVVPASYAWSDLGSWQALWEVSAKDQDGNVVQGNASVSRTQNSFVSATDVPLMVIGQDNLAVVATTAGVLVAPRDVGSEIKTLLASLNSES